MKRANNLYHKIVTFNNILLATKKARKGKKYKASTASFECDLEKNIFIMIDRLKNKTYHPGPYNDFYIYDPKKRLISAAPYFDRVVHHALINVIGPVLEKSFIYDTYACIEKKGTHRAVKRYKEFQKNNQYVLKCDIKKYFQNIDHEILYQKITKKIKCQDTLWLIKTIIDSRNDQDSLVYFGGDNLFTPVERKKGIPIGNLTSQIFANFYLNDFDHLIKEQMRIRHYIRYNDDFVLFGNSKKYLNNLKTEISKELSKIRLNLHENKSRTYKTTDGVDFLGYRIFPDYILIRKKIVKNYRRKLIAMVQDFRKGKIKLKKVRCSIRSWIGHAKHADSYRIRKEVFSTPFMT
jgi:retron-type reverse transcriptase